MMKLQTIYIHIKKNILRKMTNNKFEKELIKIAKILNCDEAKLIEELKELISYSNEEELIEFVHN